MADLLLAYQSLFAFVGINGLLARHGRFAAEVIGAASDGAADQPRRARKFTGHSGIHDLEFHSGHARQ